MLPCQRLSAGALQQHRAEALNSGCRGQGGEVLPKGETLGKISINFPGGLGRQCLPGKGRQVKHCGGKNELVVKELQVVKHGGVSVPAGQTKDRG